jgi:transcriptional/translational regulatory protein YebC/TACO1
MGNNTFTLHASWQEVKEKIKEKNIEISDADLAYEPGQEDALLHRLAAKMNRSIEDVRMFIESISYNKGLAS